MGEPRPLAKQELESGGCKAKHGDALRIFGVGPPLSP